MNLDNIARDIEAREKLRRERINTISNTDEGSSNESDYEEDDIDVEVLPFENPKVKLLLNDVTKNNKSTEVACLEKVQSLETPNTRKNRLAALAEQYSNWEEDSKFNSSSNKFASPILSSPSSNELACSTNNKKDFFNESKMPTNVENICPNVKLPMSNTNNICKPFFSPNKIIEDDKSISSNEARVNSGSANKESSFEVKSGKNIFVTTSNVIIKTNKSFEKKNEIASQVSCTTSPINNVHVLKAKDAQLDCSIDEPTRKPVSERLNAWKNKIETNSTPTVTNRVNSFEKKIFSANKIKAGSPREHSIRSPQYNNALGETKYQNNTLGSNTHAGLNNNPNKDIHLATVTGLALKKNSSTKLYTSKFSPNTNINSTNVARMSPKTSFNTSCKIAKTSPKIVVAGCSTVDGVVTNNSTTGSIKKNSSAHKATDEKKEKMREDFASKLKAMGFDVDGSGKCAEIQLPPLQAQSQPEHKLQQQAHEDMIGLRQTTPKVAKMFTAGKTPPAKSSLYTLLRKNDAALVKIEDNSKPTLVEPKLVNTKYFAPRSNIEYSAAKPNNFQDSFDSVNSYDGQPILNVTRSAVKFGSTTVKEYVPTTDTDTTNENITSDNDQLNFDFTDDDVKNDLNTNIDSEDFLSSSEHEDDDDNDDEGQVVNKLDLSDLLNEEEAEPSSATSKHGEHISLADKRYGRQVSSVDSRHGGFVDHISLAESKYYGGEDHGGSCSDMTNQPIENENAQLYPDVVMRKKSVTRRRSSLESFKKPRGYISIQEYRRQTRPKSQPPQNRNHNHISQNYEDKRNTVATQNNGNYKRLYPVLPTEKNIEKRNNVTDKERLQGLDSLIHQEQVVIQQTSNALNKCCHVQSAFASSPEAVECHRLLLMACKRREVYLLEMQSIRKEGMQRPDDSAPLGILKISDIRIPLKSDFLARMGSPLDTSIHYFILILRGPSYQTKITQMVSSHDWMSRSGGVNGGRGYIDFQDVIIFEHVPDNFAIDIEIYGMSMSKPLEPVSPKKKKVPTATLR